MRSRKKIKSIGLALYFILGSLSLSAQQTFKYQAELQKVDSDGFYRISLDPGLIARSKADLSDIRILDDRKHFMPYIFGSQFIFKSKADFIAFPQLKIGQGTDSVTTFIAENTRNIAISQLYVQLRNTAVQRTVNLTGSDDLEHWYAIKENISLTDAETAQHGQGTFMQSLNFPSSTYRYLKIQVFNKSKEPVAILQAGIYQEQFVSPVYIKIPDAIVKQKDSGNVSYVFIKLNDRYQINKLHLTVSGQKFYKRNINIYAVTGKAKKLISGAVINSSELADLYLSVKTDKILLEITNGDNPPLAIDKVDGYQLDQSLISYLEKGRQYYLLSGDEKAITPDYDLKFFGDSVGHHLTVVNHAAVRKNDLYKMKGEPAKIKRSKWNEWILGVSVAIAIALLILLTSRMVREVNKRKEEQNNS